MGRFVIIACLLATLALVGCAGEPALPVDTVTVPSATASARVAPPQATPMPAGATSEPDDRPPRQTATPAPFAADPAATAFPCPATPTAQAGARPLRFVYLEDGRLWLWQEETAQAAEIAVQGRPEGIAVSSDGRLIAYRITLSETQSELWVIGTGGEGERRLATTDSAEVPERYPGDQRYYGLRFAWVPGTHVVTYYYERTCCEGDSQVPEMTRFVDADTAALRFTLQPGEADVVAYAPGGRQLAALTASELRLIDTADGRVITRYGVQTDGGWDMRMAYSPDGRWLVAVTEPGFTVIDTRGGSRRDIPFDYQPYGMGGWSLYPSIEWLGDGPVFYTVFSTDPRETLLAGRSHCTVWRVDPDTCTATAVYEYTGDVWGAQLSPDRRWLLYTRMRQQQVLDLYLVDLASGRELLYDSHPQLCLYSWAPDSTRFAYGHSGDMVSGGDLYLGSICRRPVLAERVNWGVVWLGADHCLATWQGVGVTAYRLVSSDGKMVPIVTLPNPTAASEPPYELSGPLYAYFLGE